MISYRSPSKAVPTLLPLVIAGAALAFPGPSSAAVDLNVLLQGTSLRFTPAGADGIALASFESPPAKAVQLCVSLAGNDSDPLVVIVGAIHQVASPTHWDPTLAAWLLNQNTRLARGCYAMDAKGTLVCYLDRLAAEALSGERLRAALEFAAQIVTITRPKVESRLR